MNYGFIGLGAMGHFMSANLVKAGLSVVVNDVNKEAVEKLAKQGAEAAATNAEVAQKAEIIFLSLPNAAVVESVINELVTADGCQVKRIYDTSTVGPNAAKRFAKKLEAKGIVYCDSPVAGGTKGAEAGALSIMVGGTEETLAAGMEAFDIMGKTITLAGPVGSGAAVKMLNNYLGGADLVAACEVMVMAKQLDMDVKKTIDIINKSTGRNFSTEVACPPFLENRDFTPGFATDLFFKDISIALETANELKLPLAIGPATLQSMGAARAMGFGKEHSIAIVKYYEELAGVKVN